MGEEGFLYVLVNPSLPNCVKIGRTARNPEDRAQELSSATGVPTPFVVVYSEHFSNCSEAEQYVHARLQAMGARVSSNREFFTIPTTDAVKLVVEASERLRPATGPKKKDPSQTYSDPALDELDDAGPGPQACPWEQVLSEANDFRYGTDDSLQDLDRAIELYKLAAKMGSAEAYISLGEIYADDDGPIQDVQGGLNWLKQGADRGMCECWEALADVFSGGNYLFASISQNTKNAVICYRRFFALVNPKEFDPYGDLLYGQLRKYLALTKGSLMEYDLEALHRFVPAFRQAIEDNVSPTFRQASGGTVIEYYEDAKNKTVKQAQISSLMSQYNLKDL